MRQPDHIPPIKTLISLFILSLLLVSSIIKLRQTEMEGFGSGYRSCGGDRKVGIVSGKSFSANQVSTSRARSPNPPPIPRRVTRLSPCSSSAKPWSFNDPETKRRKRIAKYKVYTVEGKVKASLRNGLRWIKSKCSQIVHGV